MNKYLKLVMCMACGFILGILIIEGINMPKAPTQQELNVK